jgi:mono/diheme cytochrome c family protein
VVNRKSFAGRAALALFFLLTFSPHLPAQQGSEASAGQAIFQAKCSSCHSIGGGDIVGPDLAGVTSRRDARWLDQFIREPDVMIAKKDPIAVTLLRKYGGIPMPNLGISEKDAAALLAYLSAERKPAATPPPKGAAATGAQAAPTPAGNAASGAALFDGTTHFQNAGTQCIACHTISSLALPGGGALGPDLTGAVKKYGGPSRMVSVLAAIPFSTMIPVYRDRPLTAAEQADLTAYIAGATGVPVSAIIFVVCLGVWVMAGLFMILQAAWSRRLRSARDSLEAR